MSKFNSVVVDYVMSLTARNPKIQLDYSKYSFMADIQYVRPCSKSDDYLLLLLTIVGPDVSTYPFPDSLEACLSVAPLTSSHLAMPPTSRVWNLFNGTSRCPSMVCGCPLDVP